MTSVNDYAILAEMARRDNAHVAVLMRYRDAVEAPGNQNAASYLLVAVRYAAGLKKDLDRAAVSAWALRALETVGAEGDLEVTIKQEIKRLPAAVVDNATF